MKQAIFLGLKRYTSETEMLKNEELDAIYESARTGHEVIIK